MLVLCEDRGRTTVFFCFLENFAGVCRIYVSLHHIHHGRDNAISYTTRRVTSYQINRTHNIMYLIIRSDTLIIVKDR